MMIRKLVGPTLAGLLAVALTAPALASSEHSIGKPLQQNGLIIQPVYLQAVKMAPVMPGADMDADVHLELDIHADKDNEHGYAPGAWIPALTVSYEVQKEGSDWSTFGTLMSMVANDGPHYGANVKLDGPGKYTARFKILPPVFKAFLRHTDKETGVPAWWAPFEHGWKFTYIGIGKKGGY